MDYFSSIETHMDFEGQGRADKYFKFIISIFATVGIAWGYVIQEFSQTIYILGAGFALALLLTIPPWPMYRRRPLAWLKPPAGDALQPEPAKKQKKK